MNTINADELNAVISRRISELKAKELTAVGEAVLYELEKIEVWVKINTKTPPEPEDA